MEICVSHVELPLISDTPATGSGGRLTSARKLSLALPRFVGPT